MSPVNSRGQGFIDKCVKDLVDGQPAAKVLNAIRDQYPKPFMTKKVVSQVRSGLVAFIQKEHRPAAYTDAVQRLEQSAKSSSTECRAAVQSFLAKPLAQQLKQQHDDKSCINEDAINEMVKSLPIAPPALSNALRELVLTREEQSINKKVGKQHLASKHETITEIHDPMALFHGMRASIDKILAKKGGPSDADLHPLCAALLGVTGRRTVEILNGTSSFDDVVGHKHLARFTGQAKKPLKDPELTYVIPLLVECEKVQHAYAILRGLIFERAKKRGYDCAILMKRRREMTDSERVYKDEWYETASRGFRKWFATSSMGSQLYAEVHNPHKLRSIYMQFVKVMFQSASSENHDIKAALGHDDLVISLNYLTVKLVWNHVKPPPGLGVFPLPDLKSPQSPRGRKSPKSPQSQSPQSSKSPR